MFLLNSLFLLFLLLSNLKFLKLIYSISMIHKLFRFYHLSNLLLLTISSILSIFFASNNRSIIYFARDNNPSILAFTTFIPIVLYKFSTRYGSKFSNTKTTSMISFSLKWHLSSRFSLISVMILTNLLWNLFLLLAKTDNLTFITIALPNRYKT